MIGSEKFIGLMRWRNDGGMMAALDRCIVFVETLHKVLA